MKFRHIWLVLLVGLGFSLAPSVPAHAYKIVHQRSSALSVGRLRSINDSAVHYTGVPRRYTHAKHLHSSNLIKSIKGASVKFKTKYLLPYPGYKHQAWGNPQSIATSGRYLYVVYCPTAWKNKGRIVRYDMTKLDGLRATPRQVQKAYSSNAKKERAIRKAIKVGPVFTTGHGQSLAYNWKNHHLYMWCDKESAPRQPMNQYGYISEISTSKMKVLHKIRFRLRSHKFSVPGGHVLTFDKYGNAYFWSRPSTYRAYIYKGRISRNKVHFRLTHQVLSHGPGTRVQSMGYNPHTGKLYLVSDGSIANLPAKKLNGNGHLTKHNVKWNKFSPRRELEGLTFARNGRAYLLSNHNPEVLTSNRTSW